jgi:hypothetical protein
VLTTENTAGINGLTSLPKHGGAGDNKFLVTHPMTEIINFWSPICAIAEAKPRWSVIGWVTKNILSRAPPCFGRHVKPLARLHLQSLKPTNPHWARVVGYGPFSLCAINKEGLCSSSGDINRLLMMMTYLLAVILRIVLYYCLYFKINVEVNDGSKLT